MNGKIIRKILSLTVLAALMTASFSCGSSGNGNNESDGKADGGEEIITYSFMNCDTGRMLTLGDSVYFKIEKQDNGNYVITDEKSGKYIGFDENGIKESDTAKDVSIVCENEYERYRILVDGKALCDNDGGATNAAETVLTDASDMTLQTGWYMTKKGDKLPLRYTVYGDSISNGVNPDNPAGEDHTGCRKELSEKLLAKYGRAVAVGSSKVSDGNAENKNTLITDGFMYRHEGHNGWVITSHDGYAEVNNYGIDTLRENLQTKYCPDVIFMMIGINDVNQLVPLLVSKDEGGVRSDLVDRYMTLVRAIIENLPENGLLVCGTVTPMRMNADNWNNMANLGVEAFNTCIYENVESLNKRGEDRITVADNYGAVKGVGLEGISSDNGHLSAKGYSAMADSYYNAVINHYGD